MIRLVRRNAKGISYEGIEGVGGYIDDKFIEGEDVVGVEEREERKEWYLDDEGEEDRNEWYLDDDGDDGVELFVIILYNIIKKY